MARYDHLLRRFWVKQRPLAVVALPLKPPADRPAPRVLLSEADVAAARAMSWPQGEHFILIVSLIERDFLASGSLTCDMLADAAKSQARHSRREVLLSRAYVTAA